jgi:hypothetical protein
MKRILLLIIVSIIFSSLSYAMVYDELNGLNYNDDLYKQYGIEVYGNYTDLPDNDFKRLQEGYYALFGEPGEYRYHGYDNNFNPYTNRRFPNDASSMVRLENKNWINEGWRTAGYSDDLYQRYLTMSEVEMETHYLKEVYRKMLPFQLWQIEEPEQYIYVETFPTILSGGEGILWHESSDRVWYQTFSLNILDDKLQTPLNLEIANTEVKPTGLENGSQIIEVTLDLALLDRKIINDEVKRHIYYQREDLDGFVFEINGVEYPVEPNVDFNEAIETFEVGIGAFDQRQGFVDLNVSAYAVYLNGRHSMTEKLSRRIDLGQAEYLLSYFNTSNIIEDEEINLEDISYYNLSRGKYDEARITLESGGIIQEYIFGSWIDEEVVRNAIFEFILENELDVEDKISITQKIEGYLGSSTHSEVVEIVSKDQGIEMDFDMPESVFDIERIDAHNLTDMSRVEEKRLFIDGESVDFNYFFSGQYRIGAIDEDKLIKLDITMSPSGGTVYRYAGWIEVLTTKVKINYKQEDKSVEERRVRYTNLEDACNRAELLAAFPVSYEIKVDGLIVKDEAGFEIMAGEPGVYPVEIWADNSVRKSHSTMNLLVHEDLTPVFDVNLVDNQIYRGEKLHVYMDAYSPDGDAIITAELTVEQDSDLDGIYETTEVYDENRVYNQLGRYRLVGNVEEFNRRKEVIREFTVDNRGPITTLSFNQVNRPPKVDLLIVNMGDVDMAAFSESMDEQEGLETWLKQQGYDPVVKNFYDGEIHMERDVMIDIDTDLIKPPDTYLFEVEGYEGVLDLYETENFGYYEDQGEYDSKTTCKSVPIYEFIRSCDICGTYINPIGFRMCKFCTVVTGTTTECTTRNIWVPNVIWIDDFRGYYTGKVLKDLREVYEDTFREDARKVILIKNGTAEDWSYWEPRAEETYPMDQVQLEELFPLVEAYPHIVVVGEAFGLFSGNFDFESDPIIRKMYKIHHERGDLEGIIGSYPLSDQWLWDPPERFLLPGYYTINTQIWDEVIPDVFSKPSNQAQVTLKVHRIPVADFRLDQSAGLSLIDFSYDPDYQLTLANRGIVETRLVITSESGEKWYNLPESLESGNYTFDYSVKDLDGAWGEMSREIGVKSQPVTISANLEPESLSITEVLKLSQVIIKGSGIYRIDIDLMKGSHKIKPLRTELAYLFSSGNRLSDLEYIIPESYEDGVYSIRIKATNYFNPSEVNERYYPFDIDSPIDLHVMSNGEVGEGEMVSICASTADYVEDVRLLVENEVMTMVKDSGMWKVDVAINSGMELYVKAILNNRMEMESVEYSIKGESPLPTLSIRGDYNYWRGQINLLGERMPVDQNRLMSYEKARITLTTISEEDCVYLEFDPRIGIDPVKVNKHQDLYQLEWIIPLLDSTLGVSGTKRAEPYWLRTQVEGSVLETTFDITGNLYDRLYVQPEIN